MAKKETVILRRLSDYDPDKIEGIIKEGLEELNLTPKIQGRITIKPNVVMAHHKIAPAAYTRAEFIDGLLGAVTSSNANAKQITIAEKCGAGIPTTRMFRRAGYYSLKRKHKITLLPIEEAKKTTVSLDKGRVHKKITTAREIADNNFCIYTPKLKSNALSYGLTAAMKLNIGILCDRERMWNHNHLLDEKIIDLLEVGAPDFIATDAIEMSLGGNHLTQRGYPLGVIVMAANPVAHDSVCARILHLSPEKIPHVRIAQERGYGSSNLEDIDITGDISLDEVQHRTKDWDLGQMNIGDLDCGMEILIGEPYCQGGCHGVVLDWLHMIKDRKPRQVNDHRFLFGDQGQSPSADKTQDQRMSPEAQRPGSLVLPESRYYQPDVPVRPDFRCLSLFVFVVVPESFERKAVRSWKHRSSSTTTGSQQKRRSLLLIPQRSNLWEMPP
jgi:uncharacterized protein (DUF362 family)